MDVLLHRGLLTLGLAGVTVPDDSVDLGDQSEHEHPFSTEVDRGCNSGMSRELVGGLDDAMAERMWNVQPADLGAVLLAGHSPQLRSGVLLECR